MISANEITLSFGNRVLFKDVNIKFTPGNCYGVIGANGAGKSTFVKVLSGEISPDSGNVSIGRNERMTVLEQDQFKFDQYSVLHTVIMGHRHLYEVMTEKDAIYEKSDFSDEDGMRAAELEGEFAELNGWEAESEAARLLAGLGIAEEHNETLMKDLDGNLKVRVLLAQALFGEPDILLLDEPTNNLDLESVTWLEEFLFNFPNTVIVVSHDRHFLNTVCTHIVDIDFAKIQLYVGNYDFWYHASQLVQKQMKDDRKRREDKIVELKEFIQRFSSNAARSKQATSRQKLVEKLTLDDIPPSSRKRPYINFDPEREPGKKALEIRGLTCLLESESEGEGGGAGGDTRVSSGTAGGGAGGDTRVSSGTAGGARPDPRVLRDLTITAHPKDKIALVGPYHQAKTALFEILAGERKPDAGEIEWGATMRPGYYPKDNTRHFETDLSLIEWLRQYTEIEEEAYVRGFLGRMLFSGDESLKSVQVLSGGERVRCMLSMLMLSRPNALIMDEPTNHLDLESITALNDALIDFPGNIFFNSHDHEFVNTVATRIIELTPGGIIDRTMPFDEYLKSEEVREVRDGLYHGHHVLEL